MPLNAYHGKNESDDAGINGFKHEPQTAHDEQYKVEAAEREPLEPRCYW
jgi:hypothetical protein